MGIDLTRPLAWKTADADETRMLDDLQGNILDGHGRHATRNLFLRFGADQAAARAFIRELAPRVTSAMQQLLDAAHFQATGESGEPFLGLMISAAGYAALGIADRAPVPDDGGAFSQGMAARGARLNDRPEDIEPSYRGEIHALIIIGADADAPDSWESNAAENIETDILNLMGNSATIVAKEIGNAVFRDNDTTGHRPKLEGIEHFGYVDGRSQPLMLAEHIARERDGTDGISVWDPSFPIGQVLVPDPGSPAPATAFGSFFVFRKLEQDVAAFKTREEELGNDPALGSLGELLGATMVGRFEDGTPVVLQSGDGARSPVMNNFDYAGDPEGLRCPYHAHIRKVNPRGDSVRELGATLEEERSHIMARRGMPYGRRDRVVDPTDRPDGGVGLMFMAFQANLRDQFEFSQVLWANNPDFARPATGRDPIIGQVGDLASVPVTVRDAWGKPAAGTHPVTFEGFVKHRGGEYFFAPAKTTLASV